MRRRLLGNGRPLAAAVLALGLVAIAVPAFGKGGDAGGSTKAREHGARRLALSPSPPLDGKLRDRIAKTAECMRNHDIPGVEESSHGFLIPREVTETRAFRAAAKECDAPPLPPRGELLPAPMRAPGGRAEFDGRVARCLGPHRRR
jgi:hypothetical protein